MVGKRLGRAVSETVGQGESGEVRALERQPLPPQLLSFHSHAQAVSSKFFKKSVNVTLQRTIVTQKAPGRLSGERGRKSHGLSRHPPAAGDTEVLLTGTGCTFPRHTRLG